MLKLIAIVEDESDISELIALNLEKSGFKTKKFPEASSFRRFIGKYKIDLVILDLMLPDDDGFDVCRFLKNNEKTSSIPVIILSAKSEEVDKVLGLELGADDYMTKPFSPRELVARVKAVLRRKETQTKSDSEKIRITDSITMDLQKHSVAVNGKQLDLTSTEFRILQLLSSKKGWVFSREQILDYLWGNEKAVIDRTIDVHIKHLREKLGKSGKIIKNIRSAGYKLEE